MVMVRRFIVAARFSPGVGGRRAPTLYASANTVHSGFALDFGPACHGRHGPLGLGVDDDLGGADDHAAQQLVQVRSRD